MTVGTLLVRGPWALLDQGVYQYAARMMLLCVALGLAVLWPMVRLSQAVPIRQGPASAIFKDMLVLLPPAQAVVWAQAAARSGWAVDLIAAMAVSLWAWPMLAGAVLAFVLRPAARGQQATGRPGAQVLDAGTVHASARGPGSLRRTLVMLALVIAATLPLLALRLGPGWAAALSPLSAVLDLTRPRPVGPGQPSVDAGRWIALGLLLALAFLAWVILAVADARASTTPARHADADHRPGTPGGR